MPKAPASGQTVHRIRGFRLVTKDLRRLTRFYGDALGFAVIGDDEPIEPAEMRLLGLNGSGRRQALGIGRERIALDQYEVTGRPYPAGGDAASLWFQHLALVVTDIAEAYARLRDATPISTGGPQQLPASSGGVTAFKFRDPEGHPLELLQFPPGNASNIRHEPVSSPGQIALGIDHSAISVHDMAESEAFYAALGLSRGPGSFNQGPAQQRLDDLPDVAVAVTPMIPEHDPPHVELLGYRAPRAGAGPKLAANDVAGTRIVWQGSVAALVRDPDGHFHQIES